MTHLRSAKWFAVVATISWLAWMAFVGDLSRQDMLLGAGCATLAATFCVLTWRSMRLLIALRPSDFLEGWRLPATLVAGAWQVIAVLARDLAGGQRAGSIFCAVPFERRSNRFGFLRRVLATAYTTVSPSSIVIGIDRRRGLILWHEIARGEVSLITKHLGAHA